MGTFNKTKAGESERDKAVNLLKKGDELLNNNKSGDAMKQYMQAVMILEDLKKKEDSKDNKWYLALACERVGKIYLLHDKNFSAAARTLDACVALREELLKGEEADRFERALRLAYELAGTAYVQVDWERGEDYLRKHNRLCRKIADRTQLLEDHMELAGSYDYLLDLYEDEAQKTWNIIQMKDIYEQLHKHLPENKEIAERLEYAEKLYIEHEVMHELEDSEKDLKRVLETGSFKEAGKWCEKIAKCIVAIAIKMDPSLESIDAGIDYYHNAAEHYKKAGDIEEAVRCYEEAITMRKGLVRSAAQAGENSHIYDVANARLGASYLLAATTEPSEEKIKNYAKEAYEIFRNLSENHPDEDNFIKFRDWMRTLI